MTVSQGIRAFSPLPPGGRVRRFAADCVLVDDFGGARNATERLLAAGHRRIGFLGSPPAVYTGTERLRGYAAALEAAGVAVDETYVRQGQQQTGEAARAATALLALPEPPTALFCSNNRNTIGAFRAISAAGTSTALAGFDDFELADALGLPLTLVAYDSDELGREAGRLLADRIAAKDERGDKGIKGDKKGGGPPRRTVVPTTLVEYGPPPPRRPAAP